MNQLQSQPSGLTADPDRTELTIILDSSGSMSPMAQAAVCGFDAFVTSQLSNSSALLSLYTFSDDVANIFASQPLPSIKPLIFNPEGRTALLDGIGRAITDTLRKPPTRNAVFLIISDGLENFSRVYAKSLIRQMIEHCQNTLGWKFAFLGAADYAWREALELGIPQNHTATYTPDADGMQQLFVRLAAAVNQLKLTGEFRLLPEHRN